MSKRKRFMVDGNKLVPLTCETENNLVQAEKLAQENKQKFKQKAIERAQQFQISLKSVMVSEDHDKKPFQKGNDLLVLSSSSLGNERATECYHFYKKNCVPGEILGNGHLKFDNIYAEEDYSTNGEMEISFKIYEIDTDNDDVHKVIDKIEDSAGGLTGVFPAAIPYVALGTTISNLGQSVINCFRKNKLVFALDISLNPLGTRDRAILREGTYVCFNDDIDPEKYFVDDYKVLKKQAKDGKEEDAGDTAYVVFKVHNTILSDSPHKLIENHKVAKIVEQIKSDNTSGMDNLKDSVKQVVELSGKYKKLERFSELCKKEANLNESEKKLKESLQKNLKDFLPETFKEVVKNEQQAGV